MTLPVLIVDYNSKTLEDCLVSLLNQTIRPSCVYILNNGDPPCAEYKSKLKVDQDFKLHVIQNDKNLGFAGALHTFLATFEESSHVAILNPDAFPRKNWLENMLKGISKYPDAASYASLMLKANDLSCIDGVGDLCHFTGLTWRKGHGQRVDGYPEPEDRIFSGCGASVVINLRAYHEVGGFDPSYFCYQEDVDLGFRFQLAGYENFLIPDAVVEHIGGETSGRRSEFETYHGHRNLEWTFFKNMPWGLLILFFVPHFLMVLMMYFVSLKRGQGMIYLKSKWDALRGMPHLLLVSRPQAQKLKVISSWTLLKKIQWSLRR